MIKHARKHWKTTLIGAIGAAATCAGPLLVTGTMDRVDIALAALCAALGFIAKDPDLP